MTPNALPPPPVQTYPAGFLGFLGIKNGGQNPGYLNPGLSVVFDLFKFYCQGARETPGTDILAFTNYQQSIASSFYKVPAGQMWYVIDAWFAAPLSATAFSYVDMSVRDATSFNQSLWRDLTPTIRPLANETPILRTGDFFMQSNEQVFLSLNGVAGVAALSWTMAMTIVRFQK